MSHVTLKTSLKSGYLHDKKGPNEPSKQPRPERAATVMKETDREEKVQSSRRKFFKKASATAAAAIAAGTGIVAINKADSGTGKKKGRKNQVSKKLGELSQQPPDSAFSRLRKRRMPGWRPDTADVQGEDEEEIYYLEELLGKEKIGGPFGDDVFKYFPPPGTACDNFIEPASPNDFQAWHHFNKWILGHELNEPVNGDKKFWRLLVTLADYFRHYNKALYRIRHLHFLKHAPANSPPPPTTPGDDDPPKPIDFPSTEKYKAEVALAETEWKRAIDDLNALLDGERVNSADFADVRVDTVEVNGYVVSMRVAAGFGNGYKEIGGSSSSHISISSPFKY